jgi:HPt (histidine-containing phosphotransfer) domain-containing protein
MTRDESMTPVGTPAPAADENLPATDSSALERLRRFGGDKLLREMIGIFLTNAPERLSTARSAVASDEAEVVERALHSLKSSSAQLGALRMQVLCERGEKLARGASLPDIDPLLDLAEAEFARVRAWLESEGPGATP